MAVDLPVQRNKNLQPLNSLRVPSTAEYFYCARTMDELCNALRWANAQNLPIHLLGGGSNVLLGEFIPGLVLQPLLLGIETFAMQESDASVIIRCGAGENWHEFVEYCNQQHYFGLENLALIPGCVGSAPIQNIGAYGVELCDVFASLQALNRQTMEIEDFDLPRCQFAYRDSVFKHELDNQFIILNVSLKLSREPRVHLEYPALREYLAQHAIQQPAPADVFAAVVHIRRSKLPDPVKIPNAGSFFKNPIIAPAVFDRLLQQYSNLVYYDVPDGRKKLAAAWLIDQLGWKGKSQFEVSVHDRQALVLTNPNHKSVDNVLALATAIQDSVLQKFSIELEIEPRLIR